MYLSQLVLLIISPMLLVALLSLAVSAMINTTPGNPCIGTEVNQETRLTHSCGTSLNEEQLIQTECDTLRR